MEHGWFLAVRRSYAVRWDRLGTQERKGLIQLWLFLLEWIVILS